MKSPYHTDSKERKQRSIRVLIVEDDPMVADINKKFTESIDGFTVAGMVKTGKQALEFLERACIDLVILDIFLPEKNGVEVLQDMRRKNQPVDVIMITAADDSETVSKVLRYGVINYIAKPFKYERFRAVLKAYQDFRNKIITKPSLDQRDIDSILAVRSLAGKEEMPKNFNTQTLNMIIEYLSAQNKFQSADEIGAGVGLARVTVRRYLEYLVEQDKLDKAMDYHTVGRPVHKFRIKE